MTHNWRTFVGVPRRPLDLAASAAPPAYSLSGYRAIQVIRSASILPYSRASAMHSCQSPLEFLEFPAGAGSCSSARRGGHPEALELTGLAWKSKLA